MARIGASGEPPCPKPSLLAGRRQAFVRLACDWHASCLNARTSLLSDAALKRRTGCSPHETRASAMEFSCNRHSNVIEHPAQL